MSPSTRRFVIVPDSNGAVAPSADLTAAAALLRAGGTVAFATETVYGLGANALDPDAVAKIFAAKGRPAWDPLIVHLADAEMLAQVTESVPEPARLWIEHFWPGPLTLLLPKGPAVPDAVTAGRPRVGVRVPAHPVARALLREAGVPVAAPSANLFGHVSPTTAAHVLADLDGRIDAVVDAGPTLHGVESTVVDACEDPCVVYRPGAITLEQLAAVWPRVRMHDRTLRPVPAPGAMPDSLPSPGVGIRHYAPKARLVLVETGSDQAVRLLYAVRAAAEQCGPGHAGLLLPESFLSAGQSVEIPKGVHIYAWGHWDEPATLAHEVFGALRALDAAGVTEIVCPLPPCEGLGAALCDRLRKAAMPKHG